MTHKNHSQCIYYHSQDLFNKDLEQINLTNTYIPPSTVESLPPTGPVVLTPPPPGL